MMVALPKLLANNRLRVSLIIFFLVVLQYLNLLPGKRSRTKLRRPLLTLNEDSPRSVLITLKEFYEKNPLFVVIDDFAGFPGNYSSELSLDNLPLCPLIPSNLQGPVKVLMHDEVPKTMEQIEQRFPYLKLGGHFSPTHCRSRHRVAIIVPYRDRDEHLRTFLLNIHSFLRHQLINYTIFIVEQYGGDSFNRAMLMNTGAREALKMDPEFGCFIFHDVDLLPEDDRNLYTCPVQPRHMSVSVDSFSYILPYDDIFGGVSAMSVDHFKEVNGFSNLFWGWGGEDDDMSNRLRQKKLYISRYPANIARYKMLKHSKDQANPDRFKYLYSGAKRMGKDGWNSLNYTIKDIRLQKLYTWILAELTHLKS